MSEQKNYKNGILQGFGAAPSIKCITPVFGNVLVEIAADGPQDPGMILCFRDSGEFRWQSEVPSRAASLLGSMKWVEAYKTLADIEMRDGPTFQTVDFKRGAIVDLGQYFVDCMRMSSPNRPYPLDAEPQKSDRWNSERSELVIDGNVYSLPGKFVVSLLVRNGKTFVSLQRWGGTAEPMANNVLCFDENAKLKWTINTGSYHWLFWHLDKNSLMANSALREDSFYEINTETGVVEGKYTVPLDLG